MYIKGVYYGIDYRCIYISRENTWNMMVGLPCCEVGKTSKCSKASSLIGSLITADRLDASLHLPSPLSHFLICSHSLSHSPNIYIYYIYTYICVDIVCVCIFVLYFILVARHLFCFLFCALYFFFFLLMTFCSLCQLFNFHYI